MPTLRELGIGFIPTLRSAAASLPAPLNTRAILASTMSRTSRFPSFVGRAFDKNKVLIELKRTAWANSCYQSHNLCAFGDDVVVYMQKWQQAHQSEAPRRLMFVVTHVTPKKR
ncbi:hypothetical protein HDF14_000874 [Edaphobacter lichenicola]|uniref:Uncharacterized protein n=1 Tax=Tunturiibacter gelidiferens TaxID=3069689 RepID=A0A9X0QBE8_9BACT|nr:hypothetical protein [Edaphobacter lichenicola]